MCVILVLQAKQRIDFEKLKNATLNNPDGFGVVTVDKGAMNIIKHVREKGNDPDHVMEVLEENKEFVRYLHLRNSTVGTVSDENCHPFNVFENVQGNHKIVFMHNGTIHEYKPVGAPEMSDSRNFAGKFLSPLLYKFQGDNGLGDIEDPFFKQLVDRFFGTNRGLLISNRLEPLFLGKWETIEDKDYGNFQASNNDYFKAAFQHRMSSEMRSGWPSQGGVRVVSSSNGVNHVVAPSEKVCLPEPSKKKEITPLKEVDLSKTHSALKASDLKGFYDTGDEVTDDDLKYLELVGQNEFDSFTHEQPEEAGKLLGFLAGRFADVMRELELVQEKHEKATIIVGQLKHELAIYQQAGTPSEDA